jgi:hypothetical protein
MNMSMCAGKMKPNPNVQAYEDKIDQVRAIPKEEIKTPNMPVDTFLQEAENLEHWCQADREALEAAGLPWSLVEDLPFRAGALREAESRWFQRRFTKEEAQKAWREAHPAAYDLRDTILHAMRYAYRHDRDLLTRVSEITDGSGHDDMIQDLNDCAVLGRENPEPLQAIGFDMSLLRQAAIRSDEMAELLAASTGDKVADREAKTIRDQAFTFLKTAVDEVRACGQYVFWRDRERLHGYASEYFRNRGPKKPAEPPSEPSPETTDPDLEATEPSLEA